MVLIRAALTALGLCAASCVAARVTGPPALVSAAGRVDVPALVSGARLTVLVFASPDCDVLTAHLGRLSDLSREYAIRGVQLLLVEPAPAGASPPAIEARPSSLALWADEDGRLARVLGAEYSTESFVLDAAGAVRYRGPIDADRAHLRAGTLPRLRRALDALLADRPVPDPRGEALGCRLHLGGP